MKAQLQTIWLSICIGLTTANPAFADLPAVLMPDIEQLGAASPTQRQNLANVVERALSSGVPQQDVSKILSLALSQRYTAADTAQFLQKLVHAQVNDLPINLLRDKVLEGLAKKVPPMLIATAVSAWTSALESSNSGVQEMERKGLRFNNAAERIQLINQGAVFQQRYRATTALPALSNALQEDGHIKGRAGSLIAAAELTELFLLNNVGINQALSLPVLALQTEQSPQRIRALQRTVADQLRQGINVADIITSQRKLIQSPATSALKEPGMGPRAIPAAPPVGTGFPSLGFPGGIPGSIPGGNPGGAPSSGFPGGTPGAPPGPNPGGFPGGMPDGDPIGMPGSNPSAPGGFPGSTPGAPPGGSSGFPGGTPGGMPGANPGGPPSSGFPGSMPGVPPGSNPGGTPGGFSR